MARLYLQKGIVCGLKFCDASGGDHDGNCASSESHPIVFRQIVLQKEGKREEMKTCKKLHCKEGVPIMMELGPGMDRTKKKQKPPTLCARSSKTSAN